MNNLTWNVTNGFLAGAMGEMFDTIHSKLANGGRDQKVKFYWDYGRGGALYNVMARQLVGGAISELNNEAMSAYKTLVGGKKADMARTASEQWAQKALAAQKEDEKNYGMIKVNDGKNVIVAYDDWGDICRDALMLTIPVAKKVKMKGNIGTADSEGKFTKANGNGEISSDHLVWYDTTALISLSSDKDLILTRVTGRDYSRKELVSNGDLNFSISGHITSGIPDIYPSSEVQKFRQVMQYKGIIEVNNEFLDQWGVKKIVIKSFNLPSNEGNKSVQDYSFEAVGIQPDAEANVVEDTISFIDFTLKESTDEEESLTWKNILKQQMEVLKSQSVDVASQGLALASGYLDSEMAKM